MPRPGPIALVGSGEFLPAMNEIDAALLAMTGRHRPRVVILPTASWPDGEDVFRRWAALGAEHFGALGAEVEPLLVRDRFDADDDAHAQAIGEADLVYLSGGKPGHLTASLSGTRVGAAIAAAHERGAALVGCSAGAMSLAARQFEFRARRIAWPVRWRDGLGLVADATVIPHYDAFPEAMAAMLVLQSPRGMTTLGIDGDTALVGSDRSWQVQGRGRVTVWNGRRRERFRRGEVLRFGQIVHREKEDAMAQATYSVTIRRPVESVFRYVADGEKCPEWRPGVIDIKRASGDGMGARYTQGVRGPMGRRIAADYEITVFEPDRRLEFQTVTGPARPHGRYDFEAVDGGTRLTFSLDASLTGIRKLLMGSAVQKTMDSEVKTLDNLRRVLEA